MPGRTKRTAAGPTSAGGSFGDGPSFTMLPSARRADRPAISASGTKIWKTSAPRGALPIRIRSRSRSDRLSTV